MGIDIQEYKTKFAAPAPTEVLSDELKKKEQWWNKDIQLFGAGLNTKQKEALHADLAVLLNAGLDIQAALVLIAENYKKKQKRQIIESITESIISGKSLSNALKEQAGFSTYEIFSLQIGEETGQMIAVLEELSTFYGKSRKYKQMLLSALAYPIFVIGFALLVTFFLLKYLVPLFSDVYKKFDGELPMLTQKIIYLSDWAAANGLNVFLIFSCTIIVLYQMRKKIWMRKTLAALLLNIPVLGGIFHQIYLSRLCQSMYLLLRAKVPLLKTVGLVRQMIAFYPVEKSLEQAEKDILTGSSLNETFAKFKFYPTQFIALLKVGEESSTLDQMFQKLSKQYSENAEQKTAMIGSLLEPILIVCLGVLVAIILVAMYMPLFQMTVGVGN